ncbi:MAG: HAD hydrolase family protein [bacterium]|nr:HAD hydrolase family protein [bacterium]
MKKTAAAVRARARRIRAILADVDGVLTDGRVMYGAGGGEIKRFHVHDGLGVRLARRAGIRVVLASGRSSPALARRARELGVDRLWQGVADKGPLFAILCEEYGCAPREVCCIGDDLPDLPLIRKAGLGVAVPDAAAEVRRAAAYVTRRRGGEGAFRELVELVLAAQGKWRNIVDGYGR